MNIVKRAFFLYYDGFRNMKVSSKQLWIIILFKLFFMFAILKTFYFKNHLKEDFENDEQRSEHVIDNLTNIE